MTVTGEAPLLETANADRGMIIDNLRVTELPLNARNPFMLSYLSPGITYNGPAIYQRPFDNGAIADWSINGGQNRNNEFLLDGAPNNSIQGGNNIAYVPPVDAVQEFKIVTNSYDAQYGRTAGGVINVSLKSGTNNLHGSIYEFARRKAFDSNEYLFKLNNREKPNHKLDQYGFQIDGPVRIPGMYDGRNKTFFMFNYEGYKELTPNPVTFTVPDAAQLSGDFSNLRDAQGRLITIYDPNTGRLENGQWVRDPFPGNRIPENRIHPVARNAAAVLPAAEPAGAGRQRPVAQQLPVRAQPGDRRLPQHRDEGRSEHQPGDAHVLPLRLQQTHRDALHQRHYRAAPRRTGSCRCGASITPAWPTGCAWRIRRWCSTCAAASTSTSSSRARIRAWASIRPSWAFRPSLVNQLPNQVFPRLNFYTRTTGMLPTPAGVEEYRQLGRNSRNRETTTGFSLQPNFTWTKSNHSVRGGARYADDVVHEREAQQPVRAELRSPVYAAGSSIRMTRSAATPSRRSCSARSAAASSTTTSTRRCGGITTTPWFQDDWRVSDRLTLNLGVRWDINTPVFEKENRLNYGFDTDTINPVTARIQQRVPGYTVRGGLGFVDVDGNSQYPYQFDKNNIQPRVGFAYTINDRTIARGGYGLYYVNVVSTSASNGFGVNSFPITSLDGDRTSTYPLTNPFPGGLLEAPGSALGMETFLGRNPSFSNTDFVNPYVHQFSLGVQRLLPWQTTVEVSYVGSRTREMQNRWGGFNEPSLSLRNRCDPTKGGSPAFCNELLPNPFFGITGFEGTQSLHQPDALAL